MTGNHAAQNVVAVYTDGFRSDDAFLVIEMQISIRLHTVHAIFGEIEAPYKLLSQIRETLAQVRR